jgi:hypothetical protein
MKQLFVSVCVPVHTYALVKKFCFKIYVFIYVGGTSFNVFYNFHSQFLTFCRDFLMNMRDCKHTLKDQTD